MPSACFNSQPIHATNPHNQSTHWKHTEGMSLRYSVIIFYGGTKKSLAHREWVGKAMQDGMLFF